MISYTRLVLVSETFMMIQNSHSLHASQKVTDIPVEMTCLSLSLSFPACHFGKLFGVVMSVSAVISLLQYPCFALVRGALGGDPFFVSAQESLVSSFITKKDEYQILVEDTFKIESARNTF